MRMLCRPSGSSTVPACTALALVGALGMGGAARAQTPDAITTDPAARYRLEAHAIEQPIVLDGRLDEAVWQRAAIAGSFTQREPTPGAAATERTEVRVVYTPRTLYIGIVAHDQAPEAIIAREMQRDGGLFRDDAVVVLLDTFDDDRNAYFFETNPNGARTDALISEEGRGFNIEWDGVWDVKSRRTEQGWSTEMAIPFSTLRFAPDATEWGFNVRRLIRHKNEEVYWAPVGLDAGSSRVSAYGALSGLRAIAPGRGLAIKPFAVATATEAEATSELEDAEDLDGGIDLKWALTRGLNLDVTVNTDFAETEVDDQQVNLTRFSLFFPEKREFFLENAGLFDFGPSNGFGPPLVRLFFSRRIGIADGNEVPIDWGARLTGRVGPWSIGVLDVQTASRDADPDDPDDQPVASTNWGAVRIKRNIGQRSTIGVIATSRDAEDGSHNRVYGADIDWKPKPRLTVKGFAARSEDSDADIGDDWTAGASAGWEGPLWEWDVGLIRIGERFEPDLGFLLRQGVRNHRLGVGFEPRPKREAIRNLAFDFDLDIVTDLDGRTLTEGIELEPFGIRFANENRFSLFVEHNFERLDESFEIIDDVVIEAGSYTFLEYGFRFGTNNSRPLSLRGGVRFGDFFDGERIGGRLTLQWRPSRFLRTETSWRLNDVDLPSGSFTSNLIGQRVGMAFNPRLRIDALVQYNDLAENLGVNLRLNWIYRPGADLFVVYNNGWDAPGIDDLTQRERQLIVKLTYLFQR